MTRFPPKPTTAPIDIAETYRRTMERFPKTMEALRQSELNDKH